MRLLDDLAIAETEESTSRRRFLSRLTWSVLGTALTGTLVLCARFLRPGVLFELPTRFLAGRISEFAFPRLLFLRNRGLYVVKDERGVFAQSAVCTHLGCLTRPNARGDGFFCPCHGSEFGLDGRVIKGPARQPLPHFEVARRDEDLWVDVAREEETDGRTVV